MLAISGLGLAVFFYFKSKSKKEISYQQNKINLIGNKDTEFPEEIKITFNHEEIDSVSSDTLILWNSGDQTINYSDVVKSDIIKLSHSSESKILKCTIEKFTKEANDFKVSRINHHEYALIFNYMDPQDGITIKILSDNINENIHIKGTVKGINGSFKSLGENKEFPQKDKYAKFKIVILSIGMFTSGFLMIAYGILYPNIKANKPEYDLNNMDTTWLSLMMLLMGFLYCSVAIRSMIKYRRKYPVSLQPENNKTSGNK